MQRRKRQLLIFLLLLLLSRNDSVDSDVRHIASRDVAANSVRDDVGENLDSELGIVDGDPGFSNKEIVLSAEPTVHATAAQNISPRQVERTAQMIGGHLVRTISNRKSFSGQSSVAQRQDFREAGADKMNDAVGLNLTSGHRFEPTASDYLRQQDDDDDAALALAVTISDTVTIQTDDNTLSPTTSFPAHTHLRDRDNSTSRGRDNSTARGRDNSTARGRDNSTATTSTAVNVFSIKDKFQKLGSKLDNPKTRWKSRLRVEEGDGSNLFDYDDSLPPDYDVMHGFGEDSKEDSSAKHRTRSRKKPSAVNVENERNALLHEAVRKLLGFSEVPGSHRGRGAHVPSRNRRLPEYVKDLYRRFQSGEMNAGLASGNTVRSLHTKIGSVDGEPMFLFNLSSLKPSEQLLNAEVHLFRRKLKPWVTPLEVEIVLHQVAPHYISDVGKVIIREVASGWQWYDVTGAVRSCLTSREPHPHLLGLSFRKHRSQGSSKPMLLRQFGRHHSMPFLVVYSNETEAASFNELDVVSDRLGVKDANAPLESGGGVEGVNHHERIPGDTGREVPSHNVQLLYGLDGEAASADWDELTVLEAGEPRVKRSIYTNEIPEDPVDFNVISHPVDIPKTHPGILKARPDYRPKPKKSGLIPFPGESKLIPYPKHFMQKKNRRRKARRKARRKYRHMLERQGKKLRFPKDWDHLQEKLVDQEVQSSKTCSRRLLVVDFADIGWGDWIIQPPSFEAHYCAGECPFPLTKRLRPTNHATIQSIVHAIGLYDNVPAPCCVPDVMSSLTLLYFDEDSNVVLKNYPGMTVESCACR